MTQKYFNVKNGVTTGNITLHAGNSNVTANYFLGNATLSNISVTGNSSLTGPNVFLGSVANLKITGGTSDYVLTTDGTGNLTWAPIGGNTIGGGILAAYDSFVGDGSSTQYTLSVTPKNENQTFINIDGVFQLKEAYSLAGNIITFSSPPVTGSQIEISSFLISNSVYSNTLENGGLTNVDIPSANSNITMSVNGTTNVAVIHTGGINVAGNISSGYVLGNGYYLTGLPSSYSNANVASYLPTYTGAFTAANVTTTGNISGAYILGNGALLTGLPATYSNTNVASYLPTYTGNITAGNIVVSSNVTTSNANITGSANVTGNVNVTGVIVPSNGSGDNGIIFPGNPGGGTNDVASIKYYAVSGEKTKLEIKVENDPDDDLYLTASGNTVVNNNSDSSSTSSGAFQVVGGAGIAKKLYLGGNLEAGTNYIKGNGYYLTGLPATYSNTNVAAYLPTYTGAFTAANVTTTGNISGAYILGNGALLTGLPATYSNTNVASYLPTYTGNLTAGNVTATGNISGSYIIGNGSALSSITGGNVTGQVGNALIAGTVYTNAQPNITSVGTLSNLKVSGNTTTGLLIVDGTGIFNNSTDGQVTTLPSGIELGNGSRALASPAYINFNSGNNGSPDYDSRIVATGGTNSNGQGNISIDAATTTVNGNLSATGNVSASYVLGNGYYLTGISSASIIGAYSNANVAGYLPTFTGNIQAGNANLGNLVSANYIQGTLITGAQPNVTSLGTITELNVSGNANVTTNFNLTGNAVIAGNLIVNGTTEYTNVNNLYIKDPIIEMGGGVNAAPLTTNDGKDRGSLLHYYTTSPVDAFMGWDNSNAEFGFGSNVSVSSEVVTWNNYGNVRAGYFIGNGSQLSGVAAATATTAQTVTSNAQPNITSLGTLSSLNVTGNISSAANVTASYFIGNGSALTSITGGNVTGQVGNALIAGTVYTNAQPNITSLGTLSNLSITGNVSSAANITASYFIGNGSALTSINAGSITGQVANALVAGTVYTNAQPNITSLGTLASLSVTGNVSTSSNVTASYYIGNGSALSSITGGNVTGQVGNALIAGTVYTNAQPNITSLGTLNGLTSVSTVDFTGASNVSLGNVSNLHITGGLNGYYLKTDGAGNLVWSVAIASAAGNDTEIQFNDGGAVNASAGLTFNKTSNTLRIGGNITSGNANLGNLATANYFTGNGALLSSITGANVAGQVANALVASTVYTNAQPNITSLGTLANLSVTGNVSTAANVTASYYVGNGSALTSITGSSVTGQVANASVASTVYTNAQPNITSLGSLSSLTVVGNISSGNANLGNLATANFFSGNGRFLSSILGSNITGQVGNALVAGTVYNPVQSNITSLGTLASLNVTSNISSGAWLTASVIESTNSDGFGENIKVGDDAWIGDINAENSFQVKGQFDGSVGGIVFGNGDQSRLYRSGTGPLTYEGNVSANWFIGNGSRLSSLTGANVTGQVANALVAGTVYSNSQPNITSIGRLSSLNVSGNITSGNLTVNANAVFSNISVSGLVGSNLHPLGNKIYSLGTPTNRWRDLWLASTTIYLGDLQLSADQNDLLLSGNVSAGNANLGNLVTANYFSGTFDALSGAQPNITSLGSLSSLVIVGNLDAGILNSVDVNATGNIIIGGNLTVQGNTQYTNVDTLIIEDPVIEMGGGPNGAPLTTNDGKDRGSLLHYYNTSPVDAFMGWDNSNAEFAFGSNVSITNDVVTFNNFGNVRASLFIGNLQGNASTAGTVTVGAQPNITSLGTLASLNVTGNITAGNASLGNLASATYISGNGSLLSSITGANVAGQVANALVASTVYTNAQPNITSLGTLTSLNVTGNVSSAANVTASYFIGNGSSLSSITGANVTGQVGNALVAGTVYTNAQPNITSVGTLSSLTITGNLRSGNANLGNAAVANYIIANGYYLTEITATNIAGGANGYLVYQQDTNSTGFIAPGDAGYVLQSTGPASPPEWATANFTIGTTSMTLGGNYTAIDGMDSFYITGSTDASSNITGVLRVAGGVGIGKKLYVGSDINATGNVTAGNIKTNHLLYANGSVWDFTTNAAGSNTQVQFNDGNSFAGSANFTFNKTTNTLSVTNIIGNGAGITYVTGSNVNGQVGNALIAGTVYSNSQPNITSVGTLSGLTVTGTTNLTNAGNVSLGAISTVHIAGGTADYVLKTDGAGNLSWTPQTTQAANFVVDTFTGNGVQTQFTLSTTPNNINATTVNYNGVILLRSSYSLLGANVVFSSPPANSSAIEVTTVALANVSNFTPTGKSIAMSIVFGF